jgi:hypothetical protein
MSRLGLHSFARLFIHADPSNSILDCGFRSLSCIYPDRELKLDWLIDVAPADGGLTPDASAASKTTCGEASVVLRSNLGSGFVSARHAASRRLARQIWVGTVHVYACVSRNKPLAVGRNMLGHIAKVGSTVQWVALHVMREVSM